MVDFIIKTFQQRNISRIVL